MEEGIGVEVEFNQITRNGKIRHIRGLKIRDDKDKYEVYTLSQLDQS